MSMTRRTLAKLGIGATIAAPSMAESAMRGGLSASAGMAPSAELVKASSLPLTVDQIRTVRKAEHFLYRGTKYHAQNMFNLELDVYQMRSWSPVYKMQVTRARDEHRRRESENFFARLLRGFGLSDEQLKEHFGWQLQTIFGDKE